MGDWFKDFSVGVFNRDILLTGCDGCVRHFPMTSHADSHSFLEELTLLRPGYFSQKMRIQIRQENAAPESGSAYIKRLHLAGTLVLFKPRMLSRYGGIGCGHDMHLCPHPEKARTANEAAAIIGLAIMKVALRTKLPLPLVNTFAV